MSEFLKHAATGLFALAAFAGPAFAEQTPRISACFKIHAMIRADAEHYWANWTNSCPYTIDAVYVMVGFLDESRRWLGNGVWAMYFITPGTSRIVRFSMPAEVPDFFSVKLVKITTNSEEALRSSPPPPIVADRETGDPGPTAGAH